MKVSGDSLQWYLEEHPVIDFTHPLIRELTGSLRGTAETDEHYARAAYEYVRDQISHTFDVGSDVIVCRASDVLREGHGICHAKAHLLAALLRGAGIPAGLCYQRLCLDQDHPDHHLLHGLNAIYLNDRWHRVDARGNRGDSTAEFMPGEDLLVYHPDTSLGEADECCIRHQPHRGVLDALQVSVSRDDVVRLLPGYF